MRDDVIKELASLCGALARLGGTLERDKPPPRIAPPLRCPSCRGELRQTPAGIVCRGCGARWEAAA